MNNLYSDVSDGQNASVKGRLQHRSSVCGVSPCIHVVSLVHLLSATPHETKPTRQLLQTPRTGDGVKTWNPSDSCNDTG